MTKPKLYAVNVQVGLTEEQAAWIDKVSQTPYGKLAVVEVIRTIIDRAMKEDKE